MITLKHVRIYKRFCGDGDGFGRTATEEEKRLMTYGDWRLIEDFVQDLRLIKQDLVSVSYKERFYKKFNENCDGKDVMEELMKFV